MQRTIFKSYQHWFQYAHPWNDNALSTQSLPSNYRRPAPLTTSVTVTRLTACTSFIELPMPAQHNTEDYLATSIATDSNMRAQLSPSEYLP